jgi:hypothetical protein
VIVTDAYTPAVDRVRVRLSGQDSQYYRALVDRFSFVHLSFVGAANPACLTEKSLMDGMELSKIDAVIGLN